MTFRQVSDAKTSAGETISKDDFVCSPNGDHLLEVSCQRDGVERFRFMLERVN